ncbi:MAG TPA: SAM-dependent methyltransferase [Pseudonocardiaceae bacterium]|nr:SAM-dependent methyltransferase [Pseudonocardiaceae bacterium]
MLLGIVEHIMDTDEAYAIVHQLLAALPSGSYLVLCDPTTEVHREVMLEAIRQWNDSATLLITVRSRQELIRFFDGMELLEPGVVSASLWRPKHVSSVLRSRYLTSVGALGEALMNTGDTVARRSPRPIGSPCGFTQATLGGPRTGCGPRPRPI